MTVIDGDSRGFYPVTVMPLTHLTVEGARPEEKQYKLADERGMYLLIHPKGGKWWRFDYRYHGIA